MKSIQKRRNSRLSRRTSFQRRKTSYTDYKDAPPPEFQRRGTSYMDYKGAPPPEFQNKKTNQYYFIIDLLNHTKQAINQHISSLVGKGNTRNPHHITVFTYHVNPTHWGFLRDRISVMNKRIANVLFTSLRNSKLIHTSDNFSLLPSSIHISKQFYVKEYEYRAPSTLKQILSILKDSVGDNVIHNIEGDYVYVYATRLSNQGPIIAFPKHVWDNLKGKGRMHISLFNMQDLYRNNIRLYNSVISTNEKIGKKRIASEIRKDVLPFKTLALNYITSIQISKGHRFIQTWSPKW